MVKLVKAFNQIEKKKILVAGDLMLDTYTIGKARRISPEAPVAVVRVENEEHRPGGAGNVMLNLASLGLIVTALGRVGRDKSGTLLKECLEKESVCLDGVIEQDFYPTPIKNRIIAENQQIVRVDHEDTSSLSDKEEEKIIQLLPKLLESVSVVAISDYGKGFLTRKLLSKLISCAKKKEIPVIVDPKGVDFAKYKGASIIKPNFSEAYLAANLPSDEPLDQVAQKLLKETEIETLMVTRSEEGISVFNKLGREDFPVQVHEVKDVTGAGDTVLATLACTIASQISLEDAAELCNVAAGLAIERFGCARITLSDLAKRLLDQNIENKIFDDDHLFVLKEAIKTDKWSLVTLSQNQAVSTKLFSSLRQCRNENHTLVVYISDANPNEDFIDFLASLHEVDFIILKKESLEHFCQTMLPSQIFSIDASGLKKIDEHQMILNK